MLTSYRVVLLATFSLSGCVALPIPHQRPLTPVVEGVVTDSTTKAPIGGATVTASTAIGSASRPETSVEVKTDELGRFSVVVTEKSYWMFLVLLAPFEGFCNGVVTVTKPGYKPARTEIQWFAPSNFNGPCPSKPVARNFELEASPEKPSGVAPAQ